MRTSMPRAPRSPAPSRGARAPGTASAWGRDTLRPRRFSRRCRPVTELVRDSLDHCVKCTICESYCPFSQATPLFPGPKYVGPQAERYRGAGPSPDASVDYCSGCGICTQVCPQGVKIAEINSVARARLWEERGIPLRNQLIARPSVLGRLGTPVAPLANWTLRNRVLRLLGERLLGVHRDAALPRFAGRTFQGWARKHVSPAAERTVVYFHACGTNYYEPAVGRMTVEVLEHNGFHVVVPPQDCCGLPLQSNGNFPAARAYFRPLALTVPYHAPCQQQGHGIGKPALELLAQIPELRVIELDADCCGIAGTYGLKKEKYEISMAVGERLFRQVRDAHADLAACDSET